MEKNSGEKQNARDMVDLYSEPYREDQIEIGNHIPYAFAYTHKQLKITECAASHYTWNMSEVSRLSFVKIASQV